MSAHHLLEDGAASDGDNTNAPIEEVDFAVFRLEDTGGDRHKGGTVLVLFFVDGRGARGGFCNGRGLLDEVLEAVDDLDLVLLMMMVRMNRDCTVIRFGCRGRYNRNQLMSFQIYG